MLASTITAIAVTTSSSGVSFDWHSFYSAQFDRVYRLVLRAGVPAADAEDLVQQTFLIAHRKVESGQIIDNPAGWIHGVALKLVSDHYRWRKVRQLKRWLLPFLPGVVPGACRNPEQDAVHSQLQQRIGAVLAQLSPKLRDAFVLLEVEQMALDEAAAILQVPVNTLRSRRRLALQAFRTHYLVAEKEGKL